VYNNCQCNSLRFDISDVRSGRIHMGQSYRAVCAWPRKPEG